MGYAQESGNPIVCFNLIDKDIKVWSSVIPDKENGNEALNDS